MVMSDIHDPIEEIPETSDFIQFRRKQIAELRPYRSGDPMNGVSIFRAGQRSGIAEGW